LRNFTSREANKEIAEDVLKVVVVVGAMENGEFGRAAVINMVYAIFVKFDWLRHYGEVYETSLGVSSGGPVLTV